MLDQFTWYRQSALQWRDSLIVYIDPWGIGDDDPHADVVLITHAHFDHFSEPDLDKVVKDGTILVAPHDIAAQLKKGDVRAVKPGESLEAAGIPVETVPAYNAKPERKDFHPRDNNWVGYVLTLGGTRHYLAGDTDHIPEMGDIKADVAFVPIGGTYTMDVAEAAAAVKQIGPKMAVPYHFGFVVGKPSDGDAFVKAISPIQGKVLTPKNPFEQ